MSPELERRIGTGRVIATYHASRLPGLYCSTLVHDGPPRAYVHDRFVLLTLTAGEARVWCRGETHVLAPGSVLLIEPGDVHRIIDKTPYRAAIVVFSAGLLATQSRPAGGSRLGATVAKQACLSAEAIALVEAVRAGHDLAVQQGGAARLVDLLAPFWTTRRAPRVEPPLVARARRALTESPGELLSLDNLARRLGCAPTYLCRVFSEHTGVGPHAYQVQRRLLEAGSLIEGGLSVAKVATLTGFGDASHLRRHFRRRFGVTPGRYQKELAAYSGRPKGGLATRFPSPEL